MAEVWYPFACAVAVAVGWGLLHNPWLGVLPTLFLGFGDAITGAIRSAVYGREVKGLAGSLAMFAVCAALALLVSPYWIGLAGAATATAFEQATTASPRWDDNPALTIGSTLVMAVLYWGAGAV
jgi:dolichol kinase